MRLPAEVVDNRCGADAALNRGKMVIPPPQQGIQERGFAAVHVADDGDVVPAICQVTTAKLNLLSDGVPLDVSSKGSGLVEVSESVLLELGEVVKHGGLGFLEVVRGKAQFWLDQLERIELRQQATWFQQPSVPHSFS